MKCNACYLMICAVLITNMSENWLLATNGLGLGLRLGLVYFSILYDRSWPKLAPLCYCIIINSQLKKN